MFCSWFTALRLEPLSGAFHCEPVSGTWLKHFGGQDKIFARTSDLPAGETKLFVNHLARGILFVVARAEIWSPLSTDK